MPLLEFYLNSINLIKPMVTNKPKKRSIGCYQNIHSEVLTKPPKEVKNYVNKQGINWTLELE